MAQQNDDGDVEFWKKLCKFQEKMIKHKDKMNDRHVDKIKGHAAEMKDMELEYKAEKKATEAELKELKLSNQLLKTKIQEQENIIAQLSMSELFKQKYKINEVIVERKRCKIRKIQAINSSDDGSIEYKAMKTMKISNENNVRSAHEKKVLELWRVMKDLGLIEECEIYDQKSAIHCVQKLWHLDLEKYLKICGDDNMFKNNKNIALFMKAIVPKLNKMYQNNIVHCDIKPSNLMMDYDKDSNEPIGFGLIDFDFCWPPGRRSLSFASFYYRAPEMDTTLSRQPFTISYGFDMFSLGITLLELIDGKHPYHDDIEEAHKSFQVPNELNGWIDQRRIDQIIESNTFLQMPQNALLKDLIANMLVVSRWRRYEVNSVIEHEWYQKYCVREEFESQCQIRVAANESTRNSSSKLLQILDELMEFSKRESDKKENS